MRRHVRIATPASLRSTSTVRKLTIRLDAGTVELLDMNVPGIVFMIAYPHGFLQQIMREAMRSVRVVISISR